MTEWGVVGVIVVLIGIVGSVLAFAERVNKPVKELTTTAATLTVEIKSLNKRLEKLDCDNEKEHNALWDKAEEHEKILVDHDKRITVLEHDMEIS